MTVTRESFGPVGVVTINRPEKLNALNKETIQELRHTLSDLDQSADIRAIVLTGAGTKAFVAGADISEFSSFNPEEGARLAQQGQEMLFNYVESLGTPVIAAVNGYALGGGLELAMACHFRIGSENARLGLPEVTLGLIPGYGGTQRLPRLVGKGRAMEMICTARHIDAQTAVAYGLLNKSVPADQLMETCVDLAKTIAGNSPAAIRRVIRAVNAGEQNPSEGFQTEIAEFGACFGTPDFTEGTQAFLEKRPPNFRG